jgi:hypothetical protein
MGLLNVRAKASHLPLADSMSAHANRPSFARADEPPTAPDACLIREN